MALNSDRESLLDRVMRILRMFANGLATKVTARRFLVLSVAFPLGLHVIPELLAGPWPLGFDTVLTYAPFVKDVEAQGFWPTLSDLAGSHVAPLVYALLGVAAVLTAAPPFAITKAAAPGTRVRSWRMRGGSTTGLPSVLAKIAQDVRSVTTITRWPTAPAS